MKNNPCVYVYVWVCACVCVHVEVGGYPQQSFLKACLPFSGKAFHCPGTAQAGEASRPQRSVSAFPLPAHKCTLPGLAFFFKHPPFSQLVPGIKCRILDLVLASQVIYRLSYLLSSGQSILLKLLRLVSCLLQ